MSRRTSPMWMLLLEWTHAGSADLKNTNLKVF